MTVGHKQTEKHRFGKSSYHQIGLVRGQFGNVPFAEWVKFLQESNFDGWEEASWELDLSRCSTDAGAEAYAKSNSVSLISVVMSTYSSTISNKKEAWPSNARSCKSKGTAKCEIKFGYNK